MTGNDCASLDVLVVEDRPDTAWSTAAVLALYGHRVTVAGSGAAALNLAAADPDVVLLDLGLPGMGGWEVARRLRGRAGGRPPLIVAITGYGTDADRRRSAEAGIDLHLVKPVDPAVLAGVLARFARVVGGRRPEGGQRPLGPGHFVVQHGQPAGPPVSHQPQLVS